LIKGHIEIDDETVITFPLINPNDREIEFYKWGGMIDIRGIQTNSRVPGVNKKLILIIPTENGHIEKEVMGRENEVAKVLGVSIELVQERVKILTRRDSIGRTGIYLNEEVPVSIELVQERVKILTRRDSIGRTGIYLNEEVPDWMSFEEALKRMADRDPNIRKKTKESGGI